MTYCIKKQSNSSLSYQSDTKQAQLAKTQGSFDYLTKRNSYNQSLSRRLSRKDFHMHNEQIDEDSDSNENEANDDNFNDEDFDNDFNDFHIDESDVEDGNTGDDEDQIVNVKPISVKAAKSKKAVIRYMNPKCDANQKKSIKKPNKINNIFDNMDYYDVYQKNSDENFEFLPPEMFAKNEEVTRYEPKSDKWEMRSPNATTNKCRSDSCSDSKCSSTTTNTNIGKFSSSSSSSLSISSKGSNLNSALYDRMHKFENFQKVGILIRRMLTQIRLRDNEKCVKKSTNCARSSNALVFENLTYVSSEEDLTCLVGMNNKRCKKRSNNTEKTSGESMGENKSSNIVTNDVNSNDAVKATNENILKKTLKSIKRKDKLKKSNKQTCDAKDEDNDDNYTVFSDVEKKERNEDKEKNRAQSESDENNTENEAKKNFELLQSTINNKDLDKKIRRKCRSKSVARCLRRAKAVFYRNRLTKSLEDLTCNFEELKNKYTSQQELNESINKQLSKANSFMSSCSSFTSGVPSDISSSYFHELSEWSPDLSESESVSSDISFDNVDWDAQLPDLAMSEYYTSSSEDSDNENETIDYGECDCNNCKTEASGKLISDQTKVFQQWKNLLSFLDSRFELTQDVLENMLHEILRRMLNLHPDMSIDSRNFMPAPIEFIKNLRSNQISAQLLNDIMNKAECSICMATFEAHEDVSSLPCHHIFHTTCVEVWLSKSGNCPLCRYNYSNIFKLNANQNRETLL